MNFCRLAVHFLFFSHFLIVLRQHHGFAAIAAVLYVQMIIWLGRKEQHLLRFSFFFQGQSGSCLWERFTV